MPDADRAEEFKRSSKLGTLYPVWKGALRYVVPLAILLLWLFSVEILPQSWLVR